MNLMESLGRALVRKPIAWAVVAVTLLLTAASVYHAMKVDQDDDILAFLPTDNAEVAKFNEINERFGGLSVALVGIAVDDPFDRSFLEQLRAVTRELDSLPTIDYALSLTSVEDFTADPAGGIRTDYLIGAIPQTAAGKAALKERVMSRDQVVGNLISADGRAITILCFGAHDADTRGFAKQVRTIIDRGFPDHTKYWGGAPFISTYIYDITQDDMDRLIPWAVVVIVVIIVVSFRDVLGAALALVSTGMGIAISRGLMGLFGVNANIVLASMPVILFAVGSAYGIHILVRYYGQVSEHGREQALVVTMADIGPTVLAAGLTTVAGLLSFVTMDIPPMRSFGLFTAIGILATLILALTFIPAVIRLTGLRGRQTGPGLMTGALVRLVRFARRHRRPFAVGLLTISAAAALTAWRVEARMENAAFFSAGSPPDRAERFLREHFGGSNFIQLEIEGDMTDPQVLRELQRTADELGVLPHVSSVNHIGKVLSLANEAFTDERRLPTTAEQVRLQYRVLQGNSAVRQLVTDDRRYALLHIKIDTDRFEDVEELLAQVEDWVATRAIGSYRTRKLDDDEKTAPWLRDVVAARILAHLHDRGIALTAAQRQRLLDHLLDSPPPADQAALRAKLASFLRSDESMLEPADYGRAEPLAAALIALGAERDDEERAAAIAETLERDDDDELVEDLDLSLVTVLDEMWRQVEASAQAKRLLHRAGVAVAHTFDGPLERGVAAALLDLDHPAALEQVEGAGDGQLQIAVNGLPVLHRGLSKSVTANQFKSLGFALGLVLLIMVGLFRSLSGGMLAALPTVVTLLAVYGLMGLRGMHLDIGTSMIASIIIGAGVDYAVHLLAAWRGKPTEPLTAAATRSATHAGPAIWTNALMVAAGFFVLTLGEARPLQNVGGLTATAMVVAALVTFIALPVLARRHDYRSHSARSKVGVTEQKSPAEAPSP